MVSAGGKEPHFWHERAAFQRSAFGRSTAGNDVVATKNAILFSFFSFSRRLLFSEKECSYQKTYLEKVDGSAQ